MKIICISDSSGERKQNDENSNGTEYGNGVCRYSNVCNFKWIPGIDPVIHRTGSSNHWKFSVQRLKEGRLTWKSKLNLLIS